MSDQTIHAGPKADLPEPRIPAAAKLPTSQSNTSPGGTDVTDRSFDITTVETLPTVKTASRASPYQAGLGYDEDKASVFVEIVNSATGDVIQRFPAETASDELRQLTGHLAGNITDKLV